MRWTATRSSARAPLSSRSCRPFAHSPRHFHTPIRNTHATQAPVRPAAPRAAASAPARGRGPSSVSVCAQSGSVPRAVGATAVMQEPGTVMMSSIEKVGGDKRIQTQVRLTCVSFSCWLRGRPAGPPSLPLTSPWPTSPHLHPLPAPRSSSWRRTPSPSGRWTLTGTASTSSLGGRLKPVGRLQSVG
jgi:hypothetical protein